MSESNLLTSGFAAAATLATLVAGAADITCDFSKGKWNPADWREVCSVRWDYKNPFQQFDDHIMNRCPEGVSDEEVYKKHVSSVYSSMVYAKKLKTKAEITCTMSFDHLMAPEIVIANDLFTDEKGRSVYHDHFEVVIFNEGFNVWRYQWKDGKTTWRKVAFLRMPFEPKTPYTVKVTLEKRKGTKELTVSCNGRTFGYADDLLPETFYAGICGCEGRCRFYDFKVKAGEAELTDAQAAAADGEH